MKTRTIEEVINGLDDALKNDNGKQAKLCHELLDDSIWNYLIDWKHNGITKNIVFCYGLKDKLYCGETRKQIYDIMRFQISKQVERYYKRYDVEFDYITKPISIASKIALLIIMAATKDKEACIWKIQL